MTLCTSLGTLYPANGLTAMPAITVQQPRPCTTPQTFGRMFPSLPAARWNKADSSDAASVFIKDGLLLQKLSANIMAEDEADPTPEGQADDEENDSIDAGYTYVGQFLDHDITLDKTSSLTVAVQAEQVVNFRTPLFDLDSMYGSGPLSSTHLYESDSMHLKIGTLLQNSAYANAHDLPRDANGTALTGDARNDENVIIAQFHSIMLRFHNQVVDDVQLARPALSPTQVFNEARRIVTLHYQWAILTDFLPKMIGDAATNAVVQPPAGRPDEGRGRADWHTTLRFYNPCNGMPVEFSHAAYRFGHSMVRPIYRLNETMPTRLAVFTGFGSGIPDLTGFRPISTNLAIDWKFFFDIGQTRKIGVPQVAYKMDGSLVHPLSLLPPGSINGLGPIVLSDRNLLRGLQFGLPSGQDVARAMGIAPLPNDQILIGKATGDAADAKKITDIDPMLAGKTPLWTYVLAESLATSYPVRDGKISGELLHPYRLGPVGGRIIAETFVGLIQNDANSVINASGFRPNVRYTTTLGKFGFADIVRVATRSGTANTPNTNAPNNRIALPFIQAFAPPLAPRGRGLPPPPQRRRGFERP